MKQNVIYTPKQILEMFPDKDDLLYYLKMKFKNPSIELHIDKNERVIGFIVADIDGQIFTTFSTPGRVERHNDNDNQLNTALRTTLISQLSDKLSKVEKALFYFKIGFISALLMASLFFFQNHKNRPEEPKSAFKLYQDSIEEADTTIYWTEKDTIINK